MAEWKPRRHGRRLKTDLFIYMGITALLLTVAVIFEVAFQSPDTATGYLYITLAFLVIYPVVRIIQRIRQWLS
jgi:predicted membrane channel-forming protein YqfA (hemolysin III family)